MNFKLIIFYFALVLCTISFQTVKSQTCEERQAQAELLIRRLLRIDNLDDMTPITTDEQFTTYCKRAKEGLLMFKSYGASGCVSGIGKQVYSILKSTSGKALRNYCVINKTTAREYLSCFADTKLTTKYRKCLINFGETLNFAAEGANDNEIIPSLCCSFTNLQRCLEGTFESNGACTDPRINLKSYAKTFMKSLFGTITDSFCSSYTSDTCYTKEAKMMNRMDIFINENRLTNKLTPKSFRIVKNLVKLSERLSS